MSAQGRRKVASSLLRSVFFSGLFVAVFLGSLSSCGGGGGGGGGGGATAVKGQAIDAPISNATITITLNAPLTQTGAQTLASTTADSSGNFTLNISFPNSSAPVFANAQSGTTLLSSYLGPASTLAALSSLSTTNIPNLSISQVTTAALSILAATNQLSTLTPSAYATLLSSKRSDIIAAAAGIMAVVDSGCTLPSRDADTFEMAKAMVKNTSAVSASNTTSTLTSVSSSLGSSCTTTLQNLLQAISASKTWAPQLDLGDIVDNTSSVVAAGTYHIQGLLADTGISQNNPGASPQSVSAPSPFDDTAVSVSSSGAISSTDGSVSGQLYGNYLTLTVSTGGSSYQFSGKAGILPSGLLSSGSGYSLRTAGADGSGNQVKFDAVLVPQNATPVWTGISGSSEEGTSCNQGFGFRMHGLGPLVGGYAYSLCGVTGSTSPYLSVSSGGSGENDFNTASQVSLSGTLAMGELSSYPFILTVSSASLASQSGTLDYVMGSNEFVYSFTASSQRYNTPFLMNENPLDKLSENTQGSDH